VILSKSRLVQLLQLLEARELERFALFLQSPYHVQSPKPGLLLGVLQENHPAYDDPALQPALIWSRLFPGQAYQQQPFKDLMSQLSRLLKRFLALENLQKSPYDWDQQLLQALAERKAEKQFLQHRKALLKRLAKQPFRDLEYFEQQYQIARQTDQLKAIELKRDYDQALQDRADYLDLSYLIRKLQDYCEMLNRNNLQQQHYRTDLIEAIQGILHHQPSLLAIPVIRLWYQILQTLVQPTKAAVFEELSEQLAQNGHWVSEPERRAMYKYLLNFCIRRINAGESAYLARSFAVYQRMLAEDLLLVQGQLSHTDFKNIVSSGLRLKEFAWVRDFMDAYRSKVDPLFAENVYTYCLAHLHAESGEERQAIRLLQAVQFTDVYYALSARTLLLRIFYDQSDPDDLSYQIKAYQHFLRRNPTLSQRNRQLYLDFARYLKRLFRLREQQHYLEATKYRKNYEALQQALQQQAEVAHRNWLEERLGRLG
jgi:hypothetical protein